MRQANDAANDLATGESKRLSPDRSQAGVDRPLQQLRGIDVEPWLVDAAAALIG